MTATDRLSEAQWQSTRQGRERGDQIRRRCRTLQKKALIRALTAKD